MPPTSRPAGDHFPSPAMAGDAKGTTGAGGGRWAGPALAVTGLACEWRITPAGSFPPTGGGWWLSHSFSTQFTMLAPPFARAHSAKRALSELPSAGLVSAPPREMASHTRTPARLSANANRIRLRPQGL